METGTRVLLVEDDGHDAGLLHAMLRKETPGRFSVTLVARMQEAEARLAEGDYDVILLDLGLPDVTGLDTLRRARAAAPGVAIIVLSGFADEHVSTAAIKEGAQDYLIKGQVDSRALPRALRHTIDYQRMLAETATARQAQLQLRDDFLSHVSHELRGPLTSIYSFTTLIADGLAGETNDLQDDYLQSIFRNVQQLQGMIEELLEVTQTKAVTLGEAPMPEPVVRKAVDGNETAVWMAETPPRGMDTVIRGRWVLKIGGVF